MPLWTLFAVQEKNLKKIFENTCTKHTFFLRMVRKAIPGKEMRKNVRETTYICKGKCPVLPVAV